MKSFRETTGEMMKNDRLAVGMMIMLLLLGIMVAIFGLISLNPEASVVKIGYGDIGRYQGGEWSSMANSGGYQDGSWINVLAYPIMAVVLGVVHNFIAVEMYARKGGGITKIFLLVSIALLITTWVVFGRLLGG